MLDPLTYLMLMVLNGLGQGYYYGCRDQKGKVDECCSKATVMINENKLARAMEGTSVPCAEYEQTYAKARETKATKK